MRLSSHLHRYFTSQLSGFSWNCIHLLVGMSFRCWCHGLLVPSNTYRVISNSDLEFELFKGERHERDMLFQAQVKDRKLMEIQSKSPVSLSHLFCCFWAFLGHPRGEALLRAGLEEGCPPAPSSAQIGAVGTTEQGPE